MIAVLTIAMTLGHAVAVIPSVLGQRLQIGLATFACGALHVVLAVTLGMQFGVVGVLTAGVLSHGIVFGLMAWRPFTRATRMSEAELLADVIRPWIVRAAPMVALAIFVNWMLGTPPLLVTVATGGSIAAFVVWHMRPLYLEFGPVRTLYDRVVRWPLRSRGAEVS